MKIGSRAVRSKEQGVGSRKQKKIVSDSLPITHYELPITHYESPITHYPLPALHLNCALSCKANKPVHTVNTPVIQKGIK